MVAVEESRIESRVAIFTCRVRYIVSLVVEVVGSSSILSPAVLYSDYVSVRVVVLNRNVVKLARVTATIVRETSSSENH